MIGFWYALVCVWGCLFFIPKSPLWLLKVGRIEQAKVAIKKIVKANGIEVEDEIDSIEFV